MIAVMSIRETQIAAYGKSDQMMEPPERVLNLSVIGGVAYLDFQSLDEAGRLGDVEAQMKVPAKSLLRAVQAAIADDEDGLPSRLTSK